MRSKCRNCTKFGKCGFVAYFPMVIHDCNDYKRGSVNHGQDVYIETEVKRGRKPKGHKVFKVASQEVSNKSPVTQEKVEKRVKAILADFPADFKANELKTAYEQKYNDSLVFSAELRKKVCTPWKGGILINKCRVRRRQRVN